MSFQIEICLDNHKWDEFVAHSPQNNLFCRTNFLEAYQRKYDLLFVAKGELILMGVVIIKGSD